MFRAVRGSERKKMMLMRVVVIEERISLNGTDLMVFYSCWVFDSRLRLLVVSELQVATWRLPALTTQETGALRAKLDTVPWYVHQHKP